MNIERLSFKLKFNYPIGSINPSDINEDFLKQIGIIDDNNILDKDALRIGSSSTLLGLINDSSDSLKITKTEFEIQSLELTRLEFILGKLKSQNEIFDFNINLIEFSFDVHIMDKELLEKKFKSFSSIDSIMLDAVSLKSGDSKILMYSCNKGVIHLKLTTTTKTNLKFDLINFNDNIKFDELEMLYQNFIDNDFKN